MEERVLRAECLEILQQIQEIAGANAERLLADDTVDLDFAGLTLDSLLLLDFCVRLEERTGIAVEPVDLLSVSSLNEFVKRVAPRAATGI
jgi:acyl carrier protein